MPIDGREPHRIPRDAARRLVQRGRSARARAHAVSRGIIDEILAQPGCLGLRIYPAVDDDGSDTVVIVGITADESDIAHGIIAEQTRPCPPYCEGALL